MQRRVDRLDVVRAERPRDVRIVSAPAAAVRQPQCAEVSAESVRLQSLAHRGWWRGPPHSCVRMFVHFGGGIR